MFSSHYDPSLSWPRGILIPRFFKYVSIIDSDSIEKLPARKQIIPDLFNTRQSTAAKVINARMAAE
ncbi:MAG: hypothetical protein KAT01_06590 [Candidatus Aminicenantes bacterium]|nr:hypothetical protein [Candidatus Aminicenantes bacterium]